MPSSRPPLSPREGWLSDGRQVLHFRPARWDRWSQQLQIISGEWIPGETVPLLRRRQTISRADALQLWRDLRRQGWRPCPPQWQLPP